MSDLFRWAVILVCVFNIGVMVALFERVGRSFLPTVWMRGLLVSQAALMVVVAVGIHAKVGHPLTFRTPLFALASGMQVAALVGIHRWYGTREGRAHSARMMKGR